MNDARALEILQRVEAFATTQRQTWYVVGGAIRDHLLRRQPVKPNIDLAVPAHAVAMAEALARNLEGTCVPLDEAFGTARVVVSLGSDDHLELDLAEFRGPTIEDDLRRRDFTINAMAARLSDWIRNPKTPSPILDPLGGQQALAKKQLIPCFPGTFQDDPLRILRAARFVAQLGMALHPEASPMIRDAAPQLQNISGERIRDELIFAFSTPAAHIAASLLNDLRVLDVLVPELVLGRGVDQGTYHHLDVLSHQLEAVAQADRFLTDFAEFSEPLRAPLTTYCAESLVEGRPRHALIKFSSLFHDIGKPMKRTVEPDGEVWFIGHEHAGAELMPAILERLRFSTRESQMITELVRQHLRPGFLSREPQLTRRAVYRFYKDLGHHGPACLLLWWADRMATRGPKSRTDQIDLQRRFVEEMLNAYFFKAEEVVKPPRLLDGVQLMKALTLPPGPLIGDLLEVIEEAQAEGRIHTSEEALALAKDALKHSHE